MGTQTVGGAEDRQGGERFSREKLERRQGRDQGSAPSGCSTGGFASPGVEGRRREKPGCWRGPQGGCWRRPPAFHAGGRMRVPPSPQTQGDRAVLGTQAGCVPPREETSRGPGRGRRKTKRGRGSGGERQPGASGAGCGPTGQGMPGPVRPSPGGASIRIAAVTGGGARPGRRARRGAALQHCRSPLLPRSFSALRRRSAPEAQPGARTGPAALRSHSHGTSVAAAPRSPA